MIPDLPVIPPVPDSGNGKPNGNGGAHEAMAKENTVIKGQKYIKGQFLPGHSGNPKGRPRGIVNINHILIKRIKSFKVNGKDGATVAYMDALLLRCLQDAALAKTLMDKLFSDATPKEGVTINNNNSLESILARIAEEKTEGGLKIPERWKAGAELE